MALTPGVYKRSVCVCEGGGNSLKNRKVVTGTMSPIIVTLGRGNDMVCPVTEHVTDTNTGHVDLHGDPKVADRLTRRNDKSCSRVLDYLLLDPQLRWLVLLRMVSLNTKRSFVSHTSV